MSILFCEHCRQDRQVYYGIVIVSSGAKAVRARCLSCGNPPTRNDPSYAQKNFKIDELPIISTDNFDKSYPCVVCGKLGTEWHHFAPRHLFDNADDWPAASLCLEHHHEWHNKLTPKMGGRK